MIYADAQQLCLGDSVGLWRQRVNLNSKDLESIGLGFAKKNARVLTLEILMPQRQSDFVFCKSDICTPSNALQRYFVGAGTGGVSTVGADGSAGNSISTFAVLRSSVT